MTLDQSRLKDCLEQIEQEYWRASDLFEPFNSAHQGYAVILEELDELKAEVWKKRNKRDMDKLRHEASQVAAMAVRFMMDIWR